MSLHLITHYKGKANANGFAFVHLQFQHLAEVFIQNDLEQNTPCSGVHQLQILSRRPTYTS